MTNWKLAFLQAGWYENKKIIAWATSGIILFVIAIIATPFIKQFSQNMPSSALRMAISIFPFYFSISGPWALLKYKQRQYQLKLKNESGYIISLFIIFMDAGFTIDLALERIVVLLTKHQFKSAIPFSHALYDLRYLENRNDAWENLITNTGLGDTYQFVRILGQSERYGSPYAIQLLAKQRSLLLSLRTRKMEIAAAKAAAKMSVPLIIFVLPPVTIAVIGPAIIQSFQLI